MPSNEANSFGLHGDGIFVSYSATSFNGDPLLTYHDSVRNLNFRGTNDIQVEKTQIGDLVTVVIAPSIDSGFTTFSILIPKTNLSGGHVNVTTFGVTTLHRRLVVGPPLLGQTEIYHSHRLVGTGDFVVP